MRASRPASSGRLGSRVAACLLAALALLPAPLAPRAVAREAPPQDAAQDTAGLPAAAQDAPAGPARGTEAAVATRLDSLAAVIRELAEVQDSLAGLVDRMAADSAGLVGGELRTRAEQARNFGLRSLLAIIVLILAFLIIRSATWLLDSLSERSASRRLLYKRLVPIVRVVVWALTIVVILRVIFGLDGRTLLAASAGLGVAIGFAAQDLLKNIFGGLVIIGDRPFQVGDKIRIGETYGEVMSIGLRSTKISTPDDNLVTVPNSLVLSGQVANANAGALDCQVVTDLYLPGWVDTRKAKEIAYRAAVTSRYVYLKKPVVVIVRDEVRHTFLTHLRVKAYVQDIRHEFLFMSDVTDRARAAFVEAGLLPSWHGATAWADMASNGDEGDEGDAAGVAEDGGPGDRGVGSDRPEPGGSGSRGRPAAGT